MKKIFLLSAVNVFLLIFTILFSKQVDAVYFTPSFIQKADMTEGMRLNICPVSLPQELTDTIGTKKFIDNIDSIFNQSINGECAGESKILTIASVDFILRKEAKKVSDMLFLLDGKIFNLGSNSIISTQDPENPDDDLGKIEYLYTDKVYNFDPSLTNGPYEKIENSFYLKNAKQKSTSLDDLTAIPQDFPLYPNSVSDKICDETILDPAKACLPNVVRADTLTDTKSLIDWYSKADNLNDWKCAVLDNRANSTYKVPIDAAATCFKDDIAVYVVFPSLGAEKQNNAIQILTAAKIDHRSILMFEGQIYKFLDVESLINNANLLDYSNLTDSELNEGKIVLPTILEGLPVYPNNEYINKVNVPENQCVTFDTLTSLNCGGDTYTLLSSDDIDTVLAWYKNNIDSKWKCNFEDQISPEQAAASVGHPDDPLAVQALLAAGFRYDILCNSSDESKEFDARRFQVQIKAVGSVISQIMLFIPRSISSSESSSIISSEIAGFPLYAGASLVDSIENKESARDLQDGVTQESVNLSYVIKYDTSAVQYYDLVDQISEFYKANPSGWTCSSEGVDYIGTGFEILCEKEGKKIGVHPSGTIDNVLLVLTVFNQIDRSGYIQIPAQVIPTDLKQYPNATELSSNNVPCNPDINDFADKSCFVSIQYSASDSLEQVEKWYANDAELSPWVCTKDSIWAQSYQDSVIFNCKSKNPEIIRGSYSVTAKQNQDKVDIEHRYEFYSGDVSEFLKATN